MFYGIDIAHIIKQHDSFPIHRVKFDRGKRNF